MSTASVIVVLILGAWTITLGWLAARALTYVARSVDWVGWWAAAWYALDVLRSDLAETLQRATRFLVRLHPAPILRARTRQAGGVEHAPPAHPFNKNGATAA